MPGTEPRPLVATSLADEIAYALRGDIVEGRLPLGARLQQDELCVRFGVSRTPVREALRQLHALNLIALEPSRGATVRVPSRRELADVYELRAGLEGFACELAASRISASRLAEIRGAQTDVADALARYLAGGADLDFDSRVGEANDAFHDGIRRAAGNRQLSTTVRDLDAFFPKNHVWRAAAETGELVALNRDDHEAILDAIEHRRGAAARRAMKAHVERAARLLIGALDEQGLWS